MASLKSLQARVASLEAEKVRLEEECREMQQRIYELEPCHKCDSWKSGSYKNYCEDCYFSKMDEAHKDLGLAYGASIELVEHAYHLKCRDHPESKEDFKCSFDFIMQNQ